MNISSEKASFLRGELERNRLAILLTGLLGFFAHPIYYFVWTYVLPQPYDNFPLRLSVAFICFPLIFQKYWSKRFEIFLPVYWWFCLVYALPFICTFLTIKNSFSTMWMMTEVMVIFVMALCVEYPLLLLICVFIGVSVGFGVAMVTSITPIVLTAADKENLGLMPAVMICSMVCSQLIRKGRIVAEKNKALVALAGSIAHEMRTPLAQAKFSLDNIEHAIPSPTVAARSQTISTSDLNTIYTHIAQGQSAIRRGDQVIKMILNEVSGKPIDPSTFEYLDAAQCTEEIIESYGFDTPGERDKVRVHVTRNFIFKASETAYTFVLYNLLKNALHYFKLKPEATITITIADSTVVVRDTGPGIAPQVLANLFGAFATSGKAEGTGLGLAYCKRTMQAFGGDITCNSVEGEFTEFTLHFPAITPAELQAHERAVLQKAHLFFNGKRILVVDDQPGMRLATRASLEGLGVIIDEAEDGNMAIDLLKKATYDLVIMDLNMPHLDGYAAAGKIRQGAVPNQKNIPIVAYTSESAYMAHVKTQKVGMNGFVSKPCTRVDLARALQKGMEEAAKHAKLEAIAAEVFAGRTIVVADDDGMNRKYVLSLLRSWGLHGIEAQHGLEVMEILKSGATVHAILMDMEMPGMGGLQTTQLLREHPSHQHLPVIALTANFTDSYIQKTRDVGMNDFISKPVEAYVLREKLAAVLMEGGVESALPTESVWAEEALQAKQATTADGMALLNLQLLDHAINVDPELFLECSTGYAQSIAKCLALLEEQLAQRSDFEEFDFTLHKLLGNAGAMGAYALHQYLRHRIYAKVAEDRQWPTEENWLQTCKDLYAKTIPALEVAYWKPSRLALHS